MDAKYKVVQDITWDYRRLDPIPSDDELTQFYQSHYYDLIRKGGRAPELRRLMEGGSEAAREREWLRVTLFTDIAYLLSRFSPGGRVLDVGCGTGEFILFLTETGIEAIGIEPAAEAAALAQASGLTVYKSTLEGFIQSRNSVDATPFDAITLLNVLEHVPDPVSVIQNAKMLLDSNGIICVRVPNDFNELQDAFQKKSGISPWWVTIPDHINYFNFPSLKSLLNKLGFEVIYAQSDFPMELFLLMGDNYIDNSIVGDQCHRKRINFEVSIPAELRRRIYRALAEEGLGRDILMVARARAD